MNNVVKLMLKQYPDLGDDRAKENALKEISQNIILLGLQRANFFEKTAFYGGTALRILYGLERFSEDLDFCLLKIDENFSLLPYFDSIEKELSLYGFSAELTIKEESSNSPRASAFVKQSTQQSLLSIGFSDSNIQKNQTLKIKLEVDKTNPDGARFEKKLVQLPVPFLINTLEESSLFAGKLHAIIARTFATRVKGRDFFDFLFYCSRGTKVNIKYLEAKLIDSGHLKGEAGCLSMPGLQELLSARIENVNFDRAREDVARYISPADKDSIHHWDKELFLAISANLEADDGGD